MWGNRMRVIHRLIVVTGIATLAGCSLLFPPRGVSVLLPIVDAASGQDTIGRFSVQVVFEFPAPQTVLAMITDGKTHAGFAVFAKSQRDEPWRFVRVSAISAEPYLAQLVMPPGLYKPPAQVAIPASIRTADAMIAFDAERFYPPSSILATLASNACRDLLAKIYVDERGRRQLDDVVRTSTRSGGPPCLILR